MRASHQAEPPLPTEDGAVFDGRWHRPADEHGGPARGPAAGADAAARRASRAAARAGSAPEPVAQQDPSPREESLAEPPRERAGGRSSWRPADKPEWSEPQRPMGWLTTPPGSGGVRPADETSETAPQRPAPPPVPADDLTIPLDSDEA
jgi:hypothetical protein